MADYAIGASQFAGGGFMSSPAAGTGTTPYGKRGNTVPQSLREFTIKQLVDSVNAAQDENYMADGVPISNVTIVGKILRVVDTGTALVYTIEDGTGRAECQSFRDTGDETEETIRQRSDLREGVFVRVHGSIRQHEGKKSINAFHMRPITDFNEITHHNLQAIFQHLYFTKGAAQAAAYGQGTPPVANLNNAYGAGNMYGAAPAYGGGNNAFGGGNAYGASGGGIPGADMQQEVLVAFQKAQTDAGFTCVEVSRMLNNKYTPAQVKDAAEALCGEGMVYTTVDNDSYKAV